MDDYVRFDELDGKWFGIKENGEKVELVWAKKGKSRPHLIDPSVESINYVDRVVAKECYVCGKMKPLNGFQRQRNGFCGRISFCKPCHKAWSEMNAKGFSRYGGKKRKKAKVAKRIWEDGICIAKQCPDCGELKERSEYMICLTNSDGLQIQCRDCQTNRSKDWAERNPEALKVSSHRRRAMEKFLHADLDEEQWEYILYEVFDGKCPLTGEEEDLHLEHMIPLAVGHGGTTIWNCWPCAGWLNAKKNDRSLFELIKDEEVRCKIDIEGFNHLIEHLANLCGLTIDEYIEFHNWCFLNPRTIEEVRKEPNSLELWKKKTGRK